MNISILPKVITVSYGLKDRLHELNRELPTRLRADGLYIAYESGDGVVLNKRDNTIYARYKQFDNNKYKLVKE